MFFLHQFGAHAVRNMEKKLKNKLWYNYNYETVLIKLLLLK
jgi:hypothetical protein